MEATESHEHNQHFAENSDAKEIIIKDSSGNFIIDEEGKKYIDFTSGWCVGNFGWNNQEILEAIRNFEGPAYVSPHLKYQPWDELSDLLISIMPGKLDVCFRATGGTEAVEIALQAAMAFTGRRKMIGVKGAYHGNSIATKALVSKDETFNWKQIEPPLDEEAASRLEELLKTKDVAALIMEPIILNLDVLIPEMRFMERMQELCRKYGTLIIMDEVASGFGRTGKMFATEHFNLEPDIICVAKSMSNGVVGIGATVMKKEIAKALKEEGMPYSTYGWHPLAAMASMANIRYMKKNWKTLEENIRAQSEYFRQRLNMMRYQSEPDINIIGLAITLSFDDEDYIAGVAEKALSKGLLMGSDGSIFPSLNIDFETTKNGLDILESCL